MDAPDPREERLPKWARRKLHTLRANLEGARRSLDDIAVRTSSEESEGLFLPLWRTGAPFPEEVPLIGDRVVVRFKEPGGKWSLRMSIRVDTRSRAVHISHETRIGVVPEVSNAVSIIEVDP